MYGIPFRDNDNQKIGAVIYIGNTLQFRLLFQVYKPVTDLWSETEISFENHWTELAPKKLIATAWEQLITFHELSLSEHKFYYFNNRVVPDEELLKVYSPVCGFWSETEILFKITELSYKKADIHHVRTTNYLPRSP